MKFYKQMRRINHEFKTGTIRKRKKDPGLPEYQGRGIGSEAIRLTEEIVKTYSESLYIEASARNIRAIELYRKMGYDCLNTITVRKDFKPEKFEILREEKIFEQNFEVKILRTSSQT